MNLSDTTQQFRFDLRSDILAPASPAVASAVAAAAIRPGEFTWRKDPIEQGLERRVAELLGKPAVALFPTCTAANIAGLVALGARERFLLLEQNCHLMTNERAGLEWLARPRVVLFGVEDEVAVFPDEAVDGGGIFCLENTHNRRGGTVLGAQATGRLAEQAKARGWLVFLDGSRLWNASVASGESVAALAAPADLVSVSFNKGLGAPNGAALAGSAEVVAVAAEAWRQLGGICRPSHVLAAGALAALDAIDGLAEDHTVARQTAASVAQLGFAIPEPQTNIVLVSGEALGFDGATLSQALAQAGLGCLAFGPHHVRLVFHRGIPNGSAAAIAETFQAVRDAGASAVTNAPGLQPARARF